VRQTTVSEAVRRFKTDAGKLLLCHTRDRIALTESGLHHASAVVDAAARLDACCGA